LRNRNKNMYFRYGEKTVFVGIDRLEAKLRMW